MKQIAKYALTKIQNLLLAILLLIISCIQTISPQQQNTYFYIYKYGLIFPWIECFNSKDLGPVNILKTSLSDSSLGISWYPQNIIISILLINIIVVFVRYIPKVYNQYQYKNIL